MQVGIVGLPNSTKTTIFNALTRSREETTPFSTGLVELNSATVMVPDPRVDQLSAMFRPRKTTYAHFQYNDIAGLRVGIGREGGLSGPLLNAIAQNDALLHVVRAFEDERVPHPNGGVDPARAESAAPADLVRQFGLPPDARVVATAATLVEHKGHRYLVDAVPLVRREIPAARFLFLGHGPLRAELRAQAEMTRRVRKTFPRQSRAAWESHRPAASCPAFVDPGP